MIKKVRGFTLIELLIVVAIIGILAALLIPNAMTAIQKAKQKSSMKDIMTMSTGCADYIVDHGEWDIAQDGDLADGNDFVIGIAPFYVKVIPVRDPWGSPYQVHVGEAAVEGVRDFPDDDVGEDDFVVISITRDKMGDGWVFNTADPEDGFYIVGSMSDFDNDLVAWNGSWVRCPRVARPGS